jgi:CRISPR-associated endonuclease/helicase Cas3
MASDMAPIDLLIQRMGRLWRHPKENPREQRPVDAPCFTVLCDGSGKVEPPSFGNASIYARYVLLLSWLAIRKLDELALPNGIENMIEQVYTSPAPAGLSAEWQRALGEASVKLAGDQESARSRAEGCLAPEPGRPRRVLTAPNRDLDDDENPDLHETVRALTRDAEPSITVVCLGTDDRGRALARLPVGKVQQRHARELLRFSLPVRSRGLFEALIEEQVPAAWRKNAHLRHCRALRFTQGSCSFGRFRLRLSEDEGLVIELEGAAVGE